LAKIGISPRVHVIELALFGCGFHEPIPLVIGELARQKCGQLCSLFERELFDSGFDFFYLARSNRLTRLGSRRNGGNRRRRTNGAS
jgi:hypothetical protein